jgi:hypothetical protein
MGAPGQVWVRAHRQSRSAKGGKRIDGSRDHCKTEALWTRAEYVLASADLARPR